MSGPSIYYQDAAVTLWHGDCREVTEWLAADVLVTDPPYGIAYKAGTMPGGRESVTDKATIASDDSVAARDAMLDLWGNRPALVFGSWRMPRPKRTVQRLIWHKTRTEAAGRRLAWFSAEEEIYALGGGFICHPAEPNVIATTEIRSGVHRRGRDRMTCPACNRPATAHRWERDGIEHIDGRCDGGHLFTARILYDDQPVPFLLDDNALAAEYDRARGYDRPREERSRDARALATWPPLAWADSDGMAVIEFSDVSEQTVREQ